MSDMGSTLRELVDERAPGLAAIRTLSDRYGTAQGLLTQLPDMKEKVADQIRAYDACALWGERAGAVSALQGGHQALVGAHATFHEQTVDAYNALSEAQTIGGANLDGPGIQKVKDADAALDEAIATFGEALKSLGESIQTASDAFLEWARETAEKNLTEAFISEHPELSDALHVTSMTVSLATVMVSAAAIAFPPLAALAVALPLIAKGVTEAIKLYTVSKDLEDEDILRRYGPGHGTGRRDEEREDEAEYGETAEKVHEVGEKLQEQFEHITEAVKSSGLEHAASTMEAVGHGTGGVLSGAGMVISQYNYGVARENPVVVKTLATEERIEGYERALGAAFQKGTLAVIPEIHGYDDKLSAYIVSISDVTYLLFEDGLLQTFEQWREPEDLGSVEAEDASEQPVGDLGASYEVPEGAPSLEEWERQQEERESGYQEPDYDDPRY